MALLPSNPPPSQTEYIQTKVRHRLSAHRRIGPMGMSISDMVHGSQLQDRSPKRRGRHRLLLLSLCLSPGLLRIVQTCRGAWHKHLRVSRLPRQQLSLQCPCLASVLLGAERPRHPAMRLCQRCQQSQRYQLFRHHQMHLSRHPEPSNHVVNPRTRPAPLEERVEAPPPLRQTSARGRRKLLGHQTW